MGSLGRVGVVRLEVAGGPRPAIHRQARRVHDLVLNAVGAQQTMPPEAVVTGLVATDNHHRVLETSLGLLPNTTDTIQKRPAVATRHRVAAHLVGKRRVNANQPAALAQFQRHVNRGNLGAGGRRDNGCDLHETIFLGLEFRTLKPSRASGSVAS